MARKSIIDANDQKQKKLVSFEDFEVLIGIVQDKGIVEKKSDSAIIEKILSDALIPKNSTAEHYTRMLYQRGVRETLGNMFRELAAGVSGEAKYQNARLLVEFGRHLSQYSSHGLTGKEQPYTHFHSSCLCILDKLEPNENAPFDEKQEYDFTCELVRQLPETFVAYNYFNLVLENWEQLGNYTHTYRMLSDVTELIDDGSGFRETAQNRLYMLEVINEVVTEWGEPPVESRWGY